VARGDYEGAAAFAKAAVASAPDLAIAHFSLGLVHAQAGLNRLAEEQLTEAAKLDPSWADPPAQLGALLLSRGKVEAATPFLRRAVALAPYDPELHLRLGTALSKAWSTDGAEAEFSLADRLNRPPDPRLSIELAANLAALKQYPRAIELYEQALTSAQRAGIDGDAISQVRRSVEDLRARMQVSVLAAAHPAHLSVEDVRAQSQSLAATTNQQPLAVPFDASRAMRDWAATATAKGIAPVEKAKLIFEALLSRTNPNKPNTCRTAAETFAAWVGSNQPPTCQEYTLLYLALGRSVGLDIHYALVSRDYAGRAVAHACAALFVTNRVILVDPSYGWFGVHHESFQAINDLQVQGAYLTQTGVAQAEELGLRLVGRLPEPFFWVVVNRYARGDPSGTAEILRAGLAIDPDGWWAQYARGIAAEYEQRWADAASSFRACLSSEPERYGVRYRLARCLLRDGKLEEGREALVSYLLLEDDSAEAAKAREAFKGVSQ
jgi:tetratricopeptide (TPR) repeat protein